MNYNLLVRAKILRIKKASLFEIRSLVNSVIDDSDVALSIPLNDKSAGVIFRELYECIRRLGEANWYYLGYEPLNHDISLDGLKEMNLSNKSKLNFIDRFKKIRNDANYKGLKVEISQVKDIIDFWNDCGKEACQILEGLIK